MEKHRCSNKIYAVLAGKPVVTTLFNATEALFAATAEALAALNENKPALLDTKAVLNENKDALLDIKTVLFDDLAVLNENKAVLFDDLAALNEHKTALIEAFTVFSTISRLSTIVFLRYFLLHIWSRTLYFLT